MSAAAFFWRMVRSSSTTTVYKTVWEKRRGVFVSAAASGELEVRYRIGRWVEAPVGGLLCWDSLESAERFRTYNNRRFAIFEAKAKDPLPLPPVRALYPEWLDFAESVWIHHRDPYGRDGVSWPGGTLAFRRVKLVRQA